MKKKFWIVNQVNATTAEILLYGFIGEYEAIDDAAFITDLRELEALYPVINMRVNCGGGDVYKGFTIFSAIKNSKSKIIGFVDGIAASMGAVIIAACAEVQMSKYARYMTHRAEGYQCGNSDDMREFADHLDALENSIAEILAGKTGLTKDAAKEKYITNKDRWISADQALEEKLINGIYDATPVAFPANSTKPQEAFNAYHQILNISSSNKHDMKVFALLLGLAENATEAEITAAIGKLKADKDAAVNSAKEIAKTNAKNLVAPAVAAKLITAKEGEDYETMAVENFDFVKNALAKIAPVKKLSDQTVHNKLAGEVEDDGEEPATWEALVKKGDKAVAAFKASNEVKYNELLAAYTSAPVVAPKA